VTLLYAHRHQPPRVRLFMQWLQGLVEEVAGL
jgi:hypothetical protein